MNAEAENSLLDAVIYRQIEFVDAANRIREVFGVDPALVRLPARA